MVETGLCGLLLCSLACHWKGEMSNFFFGVRILDSSPSPSLLTSMRKPFPKRARVVCSSNAAFLPKMSRSWLPASTSSRGILWSFKSQALPNNTVTVGHFTSINCLVRGRECRFLLFLICCIYSLGMFDIKVFVSEMGSSFYFIVWTLNPKSGFCTSLRNLVLRIFGLSSVQSKGKRGTVNTYVYIGDDVC